MFGLSVFWTLIVVVVLFILSGLKIVNEYQRGVRFTLGKYTGMINPGLRLVIPILQTWQRIDLRTRVVDVPDQDAITKDNVSILVNAVIFFKVVDSSKAVLEVENYSYAVSQLAQTTMRDTVGEVSLDELLTKRDAISSKIQQIIDKATDPWGIKVESVELKHIELPKEMQRIMGRQAEAEREKRSTIIKAEGEVIAATNMAKAAKTLSSAQGALHLRTLQTLNDVSSDQNNTIILGVPLELLRAFDKMGKK